MISTTLKPRGLTLILLGVFMAGIPLRAATTQPLVAIHDSELTRALATMPATAGVPTGAGTTGYQWWPTNWNYFVMPDALKEALSADGTAYAVVSDQTITNGGLLNAQGLPAYPIVISLAAEATTDLEAENLTNYVAAGGFLFVGSSAFTRNPNGSSRGNFAFATQMGVSMVNSSLQNWTLNSTFTGVASQQLINHIPSGTTLTWQMPSAGDEISWQVPYHLTGVTPPGLPHMLWEVEALDAQVLAVGDAYPYILIKPYGNGYFIYDAALQPLVAHGGWSPGMYAYGIFRNAIEWAFQNAALPVPKLSPWPYAYNAAVIFRHDGESIPWCIDNIEASAQAESAAGARGDYFFCTGALREDYSASHRAATITSLQNAVSLYGATISSHNGGLTNINSVYDPPLVEVEKVFGQVGDWYTSLDPFVETADDPPLIPYDYDYWHWGPDEFLDLPASVLPSGYANVTNYIVTSLTDSFNDIAGWGLAASGFRSWVAPFFNATRDASYQIEQQLGIVAVGEQKLSPFPHWTLATQTPDHLFPVLTLPVSDWFIGSEIAQSMETGHTDATVSALVDFYYSMGALINLYSHSSSAGGGLAGSVPPYYLSYSLSKPLVWSANTEAIYQWWLQRSAVTVTPSFTVNGSQSVVTLAISGATAPTTAVEVLLPNAAVTGLQVLTNGTLAGTGSYRINGAVVKVLVGATVSNVQVIYTYAPVPVAQDDLYFVDENAPLTVAAPGVLTGATAPGGGTLTAGVVTEPVYGTLVLNSSGAFTYTPPANFIGQDVFDYVAIAGGADSSPATVTLMVTPPSDLFFDSFARPITPPSLVPWTEYTGTWGITNDVMYGSSADGDYGYVYYNDSGWSNYIVQASIRFSSTNGPWGGGVGGLLNAATGAHYGAWVYPEGSGGGSSVLKLIKFEGWTTWSGTPMAEASLPGVSTNWHTVAMAFQGTNITVAYDATQYISVADNNADGVAPYTNGGISLDLATYPTTFLLGVSNVLVKPVPSSQVANPVANNDSYTVAAGVGLTVAAPGVLANDTGGSGPLSAVLVTRPAHGSLSFNANGSFTYTNTGGFTGTDTFTYEATDGLNTSSPATVSITVTPLVANADSYNLVQATTLTVAAPGVLSNDQGGGAGLTATLVTGPADGSLTLNANGSFTYTPARAFTGSDGFTYKAGDAAGDVSAAVAVTLVVAAEQPPVANNDSYNVTEGSTLSVAAPGVLANDTGGSGTLTATLVTGTANGSLTLNANGSFTYSPNSGFTGMDSFTYTATDGLTTSSPATVTITVAATGAMFTDDFPGSSLAPFVLESGTWTVANDILSGTSALGGYGYAYLSTNGWSNYTVQASIRFSITNGAWGGGIGGRLNAANGAHYGAWVYPEGSGGGSAVMKLIKFTGWTSWSGTPMAQASLTKGVGTNWHTVAITFQGTNITVLYDAAQVISVIDNSFSSVAPYTNGGITVDVSVYPTAYTLSVSNVVVTPATTAPVANNDSYTVAAGAALAVAAPGVLANDTGGSGALSAVLLTGVSHGSLTLNANGSFTYTNTGGFTGTDSFTYYATDGQNNSGPATVTITVTPLAAAADSYSVTEGATLTVAAPGVLGNDQGNGAGLTAALVTGPADGSLTLNANGSFTYTPNSGFTGTDSFTYKAGDAAGDVSAAVAVTLVVTAYQPPVANNDSYTVAEGATLTVAAPGVLANDTGGSGTLTAALATGPANGSLTLNANGSFTYTPNSGFTGTDTFTYTATDERTTSSPATVTITVTASTMFTDTFPGTSLAPFALETGTWTVANDVLSGTSPVNGYGYVYLNTNGWSNYTVQASIRFPNTNGAYGGGIGGRLNAANGAHYGVWVYPEGSAGGSAVMRLVKFTGWTAWSGTPMAQASLTTGVSTNWHTVAITFQGTNITVLYDTAQVISVTDNNFSSVAPYTNGGITVDMATYPTAYTLSISNVVVSSILPAPVVANNDSYSAVEGTALTVAAPGVLANDTGGSAALTAALATEPADGSLTLNANGSFTYTPNSGFTGTDSFTYTATDGQSISSPATVTITVTSSSGVLFNDAFPGSSLAPFVKESGTWTVANNALSGTCPVSSYGYAYMSTNWTDYSLQAQISFPSGAFGGGIGGRLNATTGAHYGVWVYPEGSAGGSAVIKLVKFTGWTTWSGTPMAQASLTSGVGTTSHTVLVAFQGANITVSYDGTQEISVTDSNFSSVAPYASGGITVDMSAYPTTYSMTVENVVVQSLP
jgi:hypothetical protein